MKDCHNGIDDDGITTLAIINGCHSTHQQVILLPPTMHWFCFSVIVIGSSSQSWWNRIVVVVVIGLLVLALVVGIIIMIVIMLVGWWNGNVLFSLPDTTRYILFPKKLIQILDITCMKQKSHHEYGRDHQNFGILVVFVFVGLGSILGDPGHYDRGHEYQLEKEGTINWSDIASTQYPKETSRLKEPRKNVGLELLWGTSCSYCCWCGSSIAKEESILTWCRFRSLSGRWNVLNLSPNDSHSTGSGVFLLLL
mmetsp:Transcript_38649/g.93435  ORF Transcript_38649/g.93435 Transcript_38649/m.93435 type:complete len:252 (-) Transcript_38649:556-1311(-)